MFFYSALLTRWVVCTCVSIHMILGVVDTDTSLLGSDNIDHVHILAG